MTGTTIRNLPTEKEICEMVDALVTPETAEKEAKALTKLLLTVADAENDELWHLAIVAAKYAFTFTDSFRRAFDEFAEIPDVPHEFSAGQKFIEVENEQ